jgi:hypothetical protein
MPTSRNSGSPELPRGLFGVLSLNTQAWLAERGTDAHVRILTARSRLINAQVQVAETEWAAHTRIVQAANHYEAERLGGNAVQSAVHQLLSLTQRIGERQDAIEHLLVEHDRRLTLLPTTPALPPAPLTLDVVLTDQEIKRLAGKAVKRFSSLPPAEQDAAWASWRTEIRQRFPGLAAEEICRVAVELSEFFR